MLEIELLLMVVVEDLMRFFEDISFILSAGLLPCCSFIRATELAYEVVDLLPPLFTVHRLSRFGPFSFLACQKVGCNSFPKCA